MTEQFTQSSYPLDMSFTQPVMISDSMSPDALRAGMRFGLLGAASGLGYSALRTAITRQKPGGWPVTRNMLLGAVIGSTLGTLATNKNRRDKPRYPAHSYDDVSRLIETRINKEGIYKEGAIAIGTILAALFAAMSAYGATRSGIKSVKAFKAGDKRKALGHAGIAAGEALLGLMGGGALSGIGRGIQGAGRLARVGSRVARVGKGMERANNLLWGLKYPGRLGRLGGFLQGSVATQLPFSYGQKQLAMAARPKSKPPRSAVGQVMRSLPAPKPPQFKVNPSRAIGMTA